MVRARNFRFLCMINFIEIGFLQRVGCSNFLAVVEFQLVVTVILGSLSNICTKDMRLLNLVFREHPPF